MSGDLETRRKRALYRATHRGTKELDLMIGGYAKATLDTLDDEGLSAFEAFLTVPDPALQSWVLDGRQCDDVAFQPLIAAVRAFHGLETEGAKLG